MCLSVRNDFWGYVEDINRKTGEIEFDISESTPNTPPEDSEIKVNYRYLTLLEKVNTDDEAYKVIKEQYDILKGKYDKLINGLMALIEKY